MNLSESILNNHLKLLKVISISPKNIHRLRENHYNYVLDKVKELMMLVAEVNSAERITHEDSEIFENRVLEINNNENMRELFYIYGIDCENIFVKYNWPLELDDGEKVDFTFNIDGINTIFKIDWSNLMDKSNRFDINIFPLQK